MQAFKRNGSGEIMPVTVSPSSSLPSIATTLGAGTDPEFVTFYGDGYYGGFRTINEFQTNIEAADVEFFEIQIDPGASVDVTLSSLSDLRMQFYDTSGNLVRTVDNNFSSGNETLTVSNNVGTTVDTYYLTVSSYLSTITGSFTLTTENHGDVLASLSSTDNVIFGASGADTILAGSGADSISGGYGADMPYGNKGLDLIKGENGNDTIYGGQNDEVEAIGSHGGGPLALRTGSDTLSGGFGNDSIYGGQDDDTLSGGFGDDMLWGNLGEDVFQYGLSSTFSEGDDTIYGFDPLYDSVRTGFTPATSTVQVGSDVLVTLSNGTEITLVGVSLADNPSIV
jgi:Ca2+-binding RTX toxin-like protein